MATRVIKIKISNPEQVFTPVYHQLEAAKTRFVINYGGTGSSKSFSAAQKEVLTSCKRTVRTLVIRKVAATLKDSVIPSFRNRISEFSLNDYFEENKSDRIITNIETGSEIIFRGLDDPDKLKSFEGIDRIMVEEAAELTFEDFLELNRRVRGRVNIQITLNFNPIHENHWLKKHFFDQQFDNCIIIHSTYKLNQFLTAEDREQIEGMRKYNYNQYRVYALGEWGLTENDSPWLFAFNTEKHLRDKLPIYYDGFPIYLSFDFNRQPATCIAAQMSPNIGFKDSFVHIIKEFAVDGLLEELCAQIKAFFPAAIFFVTGDASGNHTDLGFEQKNDTYYKMIQRYLNLTSRQMNLNSRNLTHGDSRQLCNTLLHQLPRLYISKEGCPGLIGDCQIATVDDKVGKPGQLKKDRDIYKMDLFDCLRYFFQRYFKEYADTVHLGKKAA